MNTYHCDELGMCYDAGKVDELVASLRSELAAAKLENARLAARDCKSEILLAYDDGKDPFARERLSIVDVGVSDNIYMVESEVLNKALDDNKRLKERIEKLEKDKNTLIEASATAAIKLAYLASPVAGTSVFKDFMSVLDTLDNAEKTVKE